MLRHLSLSTHYIEASVLAPNLGKLSLDCSSDLYKMELSDMGQLQELILFGMSGEPFGEPLHVGYGVSNFMQRIPQLRLLRINISLAPCDRVCLDHLEMLPMTSTLILQLSTYGHVFATMVLDLLQKVTGIEELTVLLKDLPEIVDECSRTCRCRRHSGWRIDGLSLPLLKKVEFKGFTGTHCAIIVLDQLLRSAKMLEQMTVTLCNKNSTGYDSCKHQLFNVFKSYPTVKCLVLDA